MKLWIISLGAGLAAVGGGGLVFRHLLGMGSRESLHWEEGVIGVVVIGVS